MESTIPSQDLIEVNVNDPAHESYPLKIPKVLLADHSAFFKDALEKMHLKHISLPVERWVLDAFVGWLRYQYDSKEPFYHYASVDWNDQDVENHYYFREGDVLFNPCEEVADDMKEADHPLANAYFFYNNNELAVEMFIFAHTYDIPRLRQDATDRLLWCFRLGESIWKVSVDKTLNLDGNDDEINERLERLPPICTFRQLMVDAFRVSTRSGTPDQQMKVLSNLPDTVANDIVNAYRCGKPGLAGAKTTIKSLEPCDYHGHKDEEERRACEGTRIRWDNLRD